MQFKKALLPIIIGTSFILPTLTLAQSDIFTAVGGSLLAVSLDSGSTWLAKKPKGSQPKNSEIYIDKAHCFSNTCVAVGDFLINDPGDDDRHYTLQTLIAASSNNGKNWTYKSIQGISQNKYEKNTLNDSACTNSNKTMRCMVVGDRENKPLLAVSEDQGKSWKAQPIPMANIGTATLNSISCSGSDNTSICASTGMNVVDRTQYKFSPILISSKDQGKNWEDQSNVAIIPDRQTDISNVNCYNASTHSICLAIGSSFKDFNTPSTPLIFVSTDRAYSWKRPLISGSLKGGFTSSSCAGKGDLTNCVVIGNTMNENHEPDAPIVAISKDNGQSWTENKLFFRGILRQVTCAENNSAIFCTAVGEEYLNGHFTSIIIHSIDGGITWTTKSISVPQSDNSLNSVSCTTKSTPICLAGGSASGEFPFLLLSTDGGITWSLKDSKLPWSQIVHVSTNENNSH